MCPANCQPTIRREYASMTKLKNTTPCQQRRYVKSASHSSSGRVAVKSRLTRSGARLADASGIVVRHRLPRRLAPWMAWARIRRLTWSRPTSTPARLSASHILR